MGFLKSVRKHKRQILVIIGFLILIGALAIAWYFISEEPGQGSEEETELAVAVEVMEVKNGPVQTYISLTGRLEPEDRIDIYSEVNGIMEAASKDFKVGVNYRKGELLLRINDDEMRQNLISQRAQFISLLANTTADLRIDFPEIYDEWANYLAAMEADKPLKPLPEVQNRRQKLFLTGRNIYGQYHALQQMEERLSKHRIYAPFSGTLTEVMINRGALVMQGQRLGEFARAGVYQLRASVGLYDRQYISPGNNVSLRPVQQEKSYTGTVERINEKVDPQMQTVEVYIRVEGEELTPGMYMEGKVAAEEYPNSMQIPRRIMVEEGAVFVIEDSTAVLREVEVLHKTSEEAVVRGLKNGSTLILEQHTAAFEGSKVSPEKQKD